MIIIMMNIVFISLIHVTSAQNIVPGIDVSHWDGKIDWTAVAKTGTKFAFAKATEGSNYSDPTFVHNWNGIRENGLYAGAYHFFRSDASIEDQLNNIRENIINKVDIKSTEEKFLAIDFEQNAAKLNPKNLSFMLISLMKSIVNEFQINPILYTGPYFWKTSLKGMTDKYPFNNYRLWIVQYSSKSPSIPKPWKNYFIWQYTNKGKVNGIKGYVDLNWLNTSNQTMNNLFINNF